MIRTALLAALLAALAAVSGCSLPELHLRDDYMGRNSIDPAHVVRATEHDQFGNARAPAR